MYDCVLLCAHVFKSALIWSEAFACNTSRTHIYTDTSITVSENHMIPHDVALMSHNVRQHQRTSRIMTPIQTLLVDFDWSNRSINSICVDIFGQQLLINCDQKRMKSLDLMPQLHPNQNCLLSSKICSCQAKGAR